MNPVAPVARPRTSAVTRIALLVLWVALGFYFLEPVFRVLEPDLDSSIHATYAYFTAHGHQFGSEVNTTAGPYGFVMFGWDYSGDLFWVRLGLDLFFTLGLSALTIWFLRAAPRRTPWQWAWLAAMLLELSVGDNLFSVAILLCGLFLVLNYQHPGRLRASVFATVFLAFLSLVKGTQLAEAFAGLFCVAVVAVLSRSWRRAAWIALTYLVAVVGWWLAAGQNPLHLFAYAEGIRRIAQGYNEAMALDTPTRLLVLGIAMALGLIALLAWTAFRRRSSPAMVAGCVLLTGFTYVSWKHGYVRSDGHMYIFIDFACVAALTVPMLEEIVGLPRGRIAARVVGIFFPIAVAAFSLYSGSVLIPTRTTQLARNLGPRLLWNADSVFGASGFKAQYDTALALRAFNYDLPHVRRIVGQRSIDFFGFEIGLLLLNRLNYQPTPMCCGTYHVYNQYFKELNYRHFLDPATRPDFLLMKLETIDSRFVTMDDSLSLLAILNLYRPVLIEDDTLLLEARPGPAAPVTPRLIVTRKVRFGENIAVPETPPGEMLLFSFSLPSNLKGNLLAFLYKPALLFMDLQGEGLTQKLNQRIIARSVAVPSLLNPTLENNVDLIALLSGEPGKKVTSLRLHSPEQRCFRKDQLTVSFYSVPRPAATVTAPLPKYYAPSVYLDPPDSVEPRQLATPIYQGRRIQYLPSPGRAVWTLAGTEREIDLTIGINEDAYLKGRTDGVTFTVELEQPGQPPQLLNRRVLQPLSVIADRGLHPLRAPLPATYKPGSKLVLRTDPVAGGGVAWGWSFVTNVRIARGNFLPSQFPGFTTLPTLVESVGCGVIPEVTRNTLMTIPPTMMLFKLPPGAHEVVFSGGLMAGSYTNGGHTDGAEFIVECLRPDGTIEPVFRRWLQPATIPADRGDQVMRAALPPEPDGSRLRLRVTTGPNDNNAWDWTYLAGFELR